MTFDEWRSLAQQIGQYMLDGSARCTVDYELCDEREDCPNGFLEVDFVRAEYHRFIIRASRRRLERSRTEIALDTVHEYYHILLYPLTRLGSSLAKALHEEMDAELSQREEEVVERLAQVTTGAIMAQIFPPKRGRR